VNPELGEPAGRLPADPPQGLGRTFFGDGRRTVRPGTDERRDTQLEEIEAAVQELQGGGGTAAVTTRAVAAAAGTQAMTIYRLYGDMEGCSTPSPAGD
jgi:hypothetical protein